MKKIISALCFALIATCMVAQTKSSNTTTIKVDREKDGNVTQEIFVIKGDGAEKKLSELEKDPSITNISVEKRVEMISDDPNSEEMNTLRKEMEIEISDIESATGKKAERVEEQIEIRVHEDGANTQKMYKVKVIENGKEKVMEWDGKGEMPAEMKDRMDKVDHRVIVKKNGQNDARLENMRRTNGKSVDRFDNQGNRMTSDGDVFILEEENSNKAQMGVMIDETSAGVRISSFLDDSPAKEAGMESGDIITTVDGQHIATMTGLISTLSAYKPGDKVKVKYMRDGKEKSTKIKLAKR